MHENSTDLFFFKSMLNISFLLMMDFHSKTPPYRDFQGGILKKIAFSSVELVDPPKISLRGTNQL